MSGKFQKKRSALPLRQLAVLILAAAMALGSAACLLSLRRVSGSLITQSAGESWRGANAMKFVQVSAFLPVDEEITEAQIETFHQSIDEAATAASLEKPETGSLYAECYYAETKLSVSGPAGSQTDVRTLGVGGDFFTFHPLQLRAGSYLTSGDYMLDRVVLDETLAWSLFGSSDVAGMEVTISGRNYPVAGVVRLEDDAFSRKARGDKPLMFLCYGAMNAIQESRIRAYEVVLPEPISNFALNLVTEKFPAGDGVIVQNTGRFGFVRLLKVFFSLAERSMNTNAVIYPYWENAARLCEAKAAQLLFAALALALLPVGLALTLAIRWTLRTVRRAKDKAVAAVEERVEENKRRHYVRRGI